MSYWSDDEDAVEHRRTQVLLVITIAVNLVGLVFDVLEYFR